MSRLILGLSIDALGASRLPELMAAAGCEITLVCGRGLAISSSGDVSHRILTERSATAVRDAIERTVASDPQGYDRVILADEPLLRAFVDRPPSPALARITPQVASIPRLERQLSKISFSIDAADAGIPVPDYRVLENPAELATEKWDGKPFVVKRDHGFSGGGVFVIRSKAELEEAKAGIGSGRLLLQEFVAGRVGATAILMDHGRPSAWYSYYLCRNWPNGISPASALEPCWQPGMEAILVKLGKMTGFDGLCGIDWVFDESSGRLLVLELNPRPTPGMNASRLVGVSFPSALAHWLKGELFRQAPTQAGTPMYRLFPQNLFRSIADRDIVEFFRTWKDAPFRSPMLLFALLRRVLTHHLPPALRRSHTSN